MTAQVARKPLAVDDKRTAETQQVESARGWSAHRLPLAVVGEQVLAIENDQAALAVDLLRDAVAWVKQQLLQAIPVNGADGAGHVLQRRRRAGPALACRGRVAPGLAHSLRGDQRQPERTAKGGEERREGDMGIGLAVLFAALLREQRKGLAKSKALRRLLAQVAAMRPVHAEVDDFGGIADRRRRRLLLVQLNCQAGRPHLVAATAGAVAGIEVLWKNQKMFHDWKVPFIERGVLSPHCRAKTKEAHACLLKNVGLVAKGYARWATRQVGAVDTRALRVHRLHLAAQCESRGLAPSFHHFPNSFLMACSDSSRDG